MGGTVDLADLGTSGDRRADGARTDWQSVQRVLDRVREHLGMEIAHLSRFTDGRQVVLAASGDLDAMGVVVGEGALTSASYCSRVVAGTLPAAIPDARRNLVTRELPATAESGIGSYVGAPVRGPDGDAVGMLCCLSRGPNPMLDDEAVRVMALAVALVSDYLDLAAPSGTADHMTERDRRIRDVLDARALRMVFQPIRDLATREAVGFEALARFDEPLFPRPDLAFAAASAAGVGVELELAAVELAFEQLDAVPGEARLGVNLSVEALLDVRVQHLLADLDGRRLAVELTEHTQVHDYQAVVAVTEGLKRHGALVVVDDAGAGFASLRHVLRLEPDVIKLDIDLIRGVDTDLARQALTRSMVQFAQCTGAELVAEGIETTGELEMLCELGVDHGQGFLLGRPGAIAAACPG